MSLDVNQNDIYLLKNNPNQLILELQELINVIIFQFIRSGYFNYDEQQDIKQQINLELFNRISNIQKQYQGKSLLRTYITVIIRNICNEISRNRKKTKHIIFEDNLKYEECFENIDPLIMEEEIVRLRKIIELYFRQKYKLILCLKLKFKMLIDLNDFKNINEDITQYEFEKFIGFINSCSDYRDNEYFMRLTSLINKYEHKDNSSDSLRKWVTDKINEIIDILNGYPPTSKYDKETFQILFEKCYYKEYKLISKNIETEA